jgi:hypothetical protein
VKLQIWIEKSIFHESDFHTFHTEITGFSSTTSYGIVLVRGKREGTYAERFTLKQTDLEPKMFGMAGQHVNQRFIYLFTKL